jgi:hypothetical protein
MLKRVGIILIVLLSAFGCGDASTEGDAVASSYTHRGTHRDLPWKPEVSGRVHCTVITGKYLRRDINN